MPGRNFSKKVSIQSGGVVEFLDPNGSTVLKVLYTAVNPNGVVSGPLGSLASGPVGTFRNTDGAMAWVPVSVTQQLPTDYFVNANFDANTTARRYQTIAAALAAAAADLGSNAEGICIRVCGSDNNFDWDGTGLGDLVCVTVIGQGAYATYVNLTGATLANTSGTPVTFENLSLSGDFTIDQAYTELESCVVLNSAITVTGARHFRSRNTDLLGSQFTATAASQYTFEHGRLEPADATPLVAGAFDVVVNAYGCQIAQSGAASNLTVGAGGSTVRLIDCSVELNDANRTPFDAGTVQLRNVQFLCETGFTYTFKSGAGVTYTTPVGAQIHGVLTAAIVTPPSGTWIDTAGAITVVP